MAQFELDFKLKNTSEIEKTAKKLDDIENSTKSNIDALKEYQSQQQAAAKVNIALLRTMEKNLIIQQEQSKAQKEKLASQIQENGKIDESSKVYQQYTEAIKANIDIKNQLSKISKDIVKAQTEEIVNYTKTESEIKKLQKGIESESSSRNKNTKATKDGTKATKEGSEQNKKQSQELGGLENNLKKIKEAQDNFANSVTKAKNVAIQATAAYISFKAALGIIKSSLEGLNSLNKISASFEKNLKILENLEGSAQKAENSLKWIEDFTSKTPVGIDEITDAFVKMRGYGMDPTNGMMETLSDTSLAMGKSLMQGVEAVADAMTGENERLKEYGIRASRGIEDTMFTWTDTSGKSKGIVVKNNQEIITSTLQAIFNEKYAGQSQKMMDTYDGLVSQMGSAFTSLQKQISEESGLFEYSKAGIEGLTDAIKIFTTETDLTQYQDEVASGFKIGAKLALGFFDVIVNGGILGIQAIKAIQFSVYELSKEFMDNIYSISKLSADIRGSFAFTEKSKQEVEIMKQNIENAKKNSSLDFEVKIKNTKEEYLHLTKLRKGYNDFSEKVEKGVIAKVDNTKAKLSLAQIGKELSKLKIENDDIVFYSSLSSANGFNDALKSLNGTLKTSAIYYQDLTKKEGVGQFASADELKKQQKILENQKTFMLDFYKQTKQNRKAFEEEMKHLENEYKNEKGATDAQWQQIRKAKTEEFNKQQLSEEVSLNNKKLGVAAEYYKAIENYTKLKETELEKYKNELKMEGVNSSSKEYKSLIEAKEKEITKSIIDIQKQRRAEENQLRNEKLTDLISYYSAVGDITKQRELEMQKYKNSLDESVNLSQAQKDEMVLAEQQKRISEDKIEQYTKEAEKQELLGKTKEAQFEKEKAFIEELKEKKYSELEIEQMLAEYRKQNSDAYLNQITAQMSMQEAFNAQLQNSAVQMQNQLLTQGEMVAQVLGNSLNSMQSGLTTFFDASNSGFLNLKDLVRNVAQDMLKQLAAVIAKQLAVQAMSSMFGGGSFGMFADGGVFSGGNEVTAFAKGGAFTNSVASSPTLAPMALFGEAGPEAIMPLQRDSSGKLGVAASGGNTGQVVVQNNVIINNNASNKVSVTESEDSNGNKVMTIEEIDEKLSNLIRNENSISARTLTQKYPKMK